jgi:cardiolipin synthase A/B
MRTELLLDSCEFWSRLKEDVGAARESVCVQTFSFEGDRVGTALARLMERCPASDRKLLVDCFSLLYHNDRLIPGPAWLERPFRREVKLTHRWARRLRSSGVGVRFGNPLGPSPTDLIRRNHKKLAVVDERIVYVGGINFSEHNFEWHDMMFRVEDPELGRVLAEDFRCSWDGRPQAMDREVGPLRVLSLNGKSNSEGIRPVIDAIRSARRSIDVVSAYLSHPFTDFLADASRSGVRVRILTPGANNKPNLARHVKRAAECHGFEVFEYAGGMSHMKAMLIDDSTLVTGSSNFDFMSFHILEELIVIVSEPEIVDSFRERVWDPDLASASRVSPTPSLVTRYGDLMVRMGSLAAESLATP